MDYIFGDGGGLMFDWSPLKDDAYLTGTLTVVVRRRAGQHVRVRGCGFI